MAAEVSSLVRILSRYTDDRSALKDPGGPRSTVALMTRDLLGTGGYGGGGYEQSLDLDLQVPQGWQKRLDLKSGKMYLKQCNSTSSKLSTNYHHHHHHDADQSNRTIPRFQDLNFPPVSGNSPAKPLLSLFDDTGLELKLVPSSLSPSLPSSSSSNPSLSYISSLSVSSSVCTLDKVKSALERDTKKRQSPDDGVCHQTASAAASPVAAGCPRCLSYVFVVKNNPKCPRCHAFVPLPAMKKPKIDLNISI